MRITLLTLISAAQLMAQAAGTENDIPVVTAFVAPAYPRGAKEQRIVGTTLTHISVNRAGVVTELRTIRAHPVFESYVVEALKKWRFMSSDKEHTLQITCSFEMDDKCEGTDKHPITSETYVSAELPTVVHIKTGLQCKENAVAQKQH